MLPFWPNLIVSRSSPDVFSLRIVGWSVSNALQAETLSLSALKVAAWSMLRQMYFAGWIRCHSLGRFLGGYGSKVFDGAAAFGNGVLYDSWA